jgi:hypothetical protein
MKIIFITLLLFAAVNIFSQTSSSIDSRYIAEIQQWRLERAADLKSEDGWLNLAGLFRLKEGKNTFGSNKNNDLVFPKGSDFMGNLILENGEVRVEISKNVAVYHKNTEIKNLKIFSENEKPVVLQHQSLRWFVIQRGDRHYLRLRDLESANVTQFKGIETFPVDKKWRVEAELMPVPPDYDRKLQVTDVIGTTSLQPTPGPFVFEIDGRSYWLYPTWAGEQLFFVFGDATNGDTTYGAGRFLYAAKPDANGKTILDFNKAYNPPCAFTAFATCPLPSKENRLPVEVNAGEKNDGAH